MPPPVSVDGIEQRQAIDGQVAVEVVMGVQNERHADQDRPEETESQHHPGPAGTSSGGVGGRGAHEGTGVVLRANSDEEVGDGAAETGKLGKVFDDGILAEYNGRLVIQAMDNHAYGSAG